MTTNTEDRTMKLYKLTNDRWQTRNNTRWGKNIKHTLPKTRNPQLCSANVLHAYTNLNLALLLNPIHGNFSPIQIWESQGKIVIRDWGKCGCFELTTTKLVDVPNWYQNRDVAHDIRVQFAILCAKEVLKHYTDKYPNDNRPYKAIVAAENYLQNHAAAYAAGAAYAADAANAANGAAYAAAAANAANAAYAAGAAYAADAANAANAAAYAAYTAAAANAANAADAAAYAANAANAADADIDFGKIADKAVKLITNKNNL